MGFGCQHLARVFQDGIDSDLLNDPDGDCVSRLRQRLPDRDYALEFIVEIGDPLDWLIAPRGQPRWVRLAREYRGPARLGEMPLDKTIGFMAEPGWRMDCVTRL